MEVGLNKAAGILGVSVRALKRRIESGEISAKKAGDGPYAGWIVTLPGVAESAVQESQVHEPGLRQETVQEVVVSEHPETVVEKEPEAVVEKEPKLTIPIDINFDKRIDIKPLKLDKVLPSNVIDSNDTPLTEREILPEKVVPERRLERMRREKERPREQKSKGGKWWW